MKSLVLGLASALVLTAIPTISHADLAFNVGAFSDYRYRGISQTRFKQIGRASCRERV